jgi:hypothetical protein
MTTATIDYTGITCIPPKDDTLRYVLKKAGNKTLYVIGLNTSTADESEPDPTVGKAMKIAAAQGYDGFVMFNLYPLRETEPSKLPESDERKLVEKNIAAIQKELGGVTKPTILAAWGANIEKRGYLGECLRKIVQLTAVQGATWQHFGDLTKDGHPRHLLYVDGESALSKFDVKKYIETLK